MMLKIIRGTALCGICLSVIGCSSVNLGPAKLPSDRDMGSPEVYSPKAEFDAQHRYDKKQELLFDEQLGVYLVPRHSGLYFYRDLYYRKSENGWQQAESATGPWEASDEKQLPGNLFAVEN